MAKAKPAAKPKILKPFMLVIAAMAGWAALHEPASFSPGSTGVWLLGALTIALLVRAALALAAPLLGIIGTILARSLQTARQEGSES